MLPLIKQDKKNIIDKVRCPYL